MKLVLLGTGGYYPTERRQTACFLLPEVGVVLDAGSGMSRVGELLATDRLDVFLTHAHLDHVLGLTYLMNVVPAAVARATTIHGEQEKLSAVREHLFSPAMFPLQPPFRFAPFDERTTVTLPSDGTLTHFPLAHPGGSLGFRLDWPGHSLAYITDTTAAADAPYIEPIRGVDLLLHECNFADNARDLPKMTGHSWLLPVAQVAAAADAGRLVLVHIGPHYESDDAFSLDEARRLFPRVELGVDRMSLEF